MNFKKFFDRTFWLSLGISLLMGVTFSILYHFESLEFLEAKFYDWKFQARGEQLGDERVIFLTLDDAATNMLGRFPIARKHYITILEALENASMVFFDIFLPEESIETMKPNQKSGMKQDVVKAIKAHVAAGKELDLDSLLGLFNKSIDGIKSTFDFDLAKKTKENGKVFWPMYIKDEDDRQIVIEFSQLMLNVVKEAGEDGISLFIENDESVVRAIVESYDKRRVMLEKRLKSMGFDLDQILEKVFKDSFAELDAKEWTRLNHFVKELKGKSVEEITSHQLYDFPKNYALIKMILADPIKENWDKEMTLNDYSLAYCHEYAKATENPDFAVDRLVENDDLHESIRWFYLKEQSVKVTGDRENIFPIKDFGPPLLAICESSPVVPYAMVKPDDDGSVRRYPLLALYRRGKETYIFASIGLVMTAKYQGLDLNTADFKAGEYLRLRSSDGSKTLEIPVDDQCRMTINWRGGWEPWLHKKSNTMKTCFDNVSLAYLLNPEDSTLDRNAPQLKKFGKDKIVLVGLTAKGSHDLNPMSFDPRYPMVGSHANVIDTLLNQRWIVPTSKSVNILFTVILALLVSVMISKLPQFWGLLATLLITGLFFGLNLWLFSSRGSVVNVIYTTFAIFSTYGFVLFYRYMTEERAKKKTEGMFGTMVAPEVLDHMKENPDAFKLGGEKRTATMFFSDVAGFTSISESLTAEALSDVLNAYLTPMSDIILDHGGYIDKYEGDAIMADYGVPTPPPAWKDDSTAHAWHCVWAAMEQYDIMINEVSPMIKEKWGVDVIARMGMNSGDVSAGNMGSTRKFQYTVMGDAVNQAARYEPANKDFGSMLMMGESTYQLSKKKVEARFLGTMIAKGKTEPTNVYEPLAKAGKLADKKHEVVKIFEDAWKLYAQKKWDEAIARFKVALNLDPEDGPSLQYIERIKTYRLMEEREELVKDWAGEFIQINK